MPPIASMGLRLLLPLLIICVHTTTGDIFDRPSNDATIDVLATEGDDYQPILIPNTGSQAGVAKLAVLVPGGKVPPEDYIQLMARVIQYTNTKLVGVIVRCGKLNLCNPLGQLNGLVDNAIKLASKRLNNGTTFENKDVFIMGHSLGGVGARHYVDKRGLGSFAGLAFFGTQYNGDHEDFKGTLGYPEDLRSFPIPLLGVLGELDMLPMSHAALLFAQHSEMDEASRLAKPIIVIPGMDHSQFCSPFNVSGDIVPEISNDMAAHYSAMATSAWVDFNVNEKREGPRAALRAWMDNSTAPITSAWIEASTLEAESWCLAAQKLAFKRLPSTVLGALDISVTRVNDSASLEHFHTKTVERNDGDMLRVNLSIGSFPYYSETASWNPIDLFAPTYASARDISCKMVSSDKIAKIFNVSGMFPEKEPNMTCADINREAMSVALNLLAKYHPDAVERFHRRGRGFSFSADRSTTMGPQWVFATALKFDEHDKKDADAPATVVSPRLYSSVANPSFTYPGNLYCKVLSPAKALEWIQTRGLTQRL